MIARQNRRQAVHRLTQGMHGAVWLLELRRSRRVACVRERGRDGGILDDYEQAAGAASVGRAGECWRLNPDFDDR